MSPHDNPGSLAEEFRYFDHDGNGRIDFDEFRALLDRLGMQRPEAVVRMAFAAIDTDADGHIDLAEFSAWWHNGAPLDSQLPDAP